MRKNCRQSSLNAHVNELQRWMDGVGVCDDATMLGREGDIDIDININGGEPVPRQRG